MSVGDRLIWVALVVLATVGVGCTSEATFPPERRLPYVLETQIDGLCVTQEIDWADLDGDGIDEIVGWGSKALAVSRLPKNAAYNLHEDGARAGELLSAAIVPTLGTRHSLLSIGVLRADTSYTRLLDLAGGVKRMLHLPPHPAAFWPERGGGPLARSAVRPILCVEDPEGGTLVAVVQTGYHPAPRGVVAYDWPSCAVRWTVPMGSQPTYWGWADIDGDGSVEVFIGTYAPGNTHDFGGTRDDESWIHAFRLDGTELWRRRVGPVMTGARVEPRDLDGDGGFELLVGQVSSNDRARRFPLLVLDAKTGEVLRQSDWQENVASVHWLSDMVEAPPCSLLVLTRDGESLLVDHQLQVVLRGKTGTQDQRLLGAIDLNRAEQQGLVFSTVVDLRVFDLQLRPMAWTGSTNHEIAGVGIVDLGDGQDRVAVRAASGHSILKLRKRWFLERARGEILTRPGGTAAGAAILIVTTGVLVILRTRPRSRPLSDRELAVLLLDWGHRGNCTRRLDEISRAWSVLRSDNPETREMFLNRLETRAPDWQNLLRPRLLELAQILDGDGRHAARGHDLRLAIEIADAAMKRAATGILREGLSRELTTRGASATRELQRAIRRCQSALAPRILCNPETEWRTLLQARSDVLKEREITIETVVSDEARSAVISSLDLRRVLENLLENAIRAIDGLPERRIRFSCRESPERKVIVDLSDSGRGISETDQARLIDGSGSGRGYKIIGIILMTYGGHLEFSPSPWETGTTVRVVLEPERMLLMDDRTADEGG